MSFFSAPGLWLANKRLAGVLLFLLSAAFLLWRPDVFSRLDLLAEDALTLRMPQPERKTPRVVVILLGEYSLSRVPRWPWPRSAHAELLKRLEQAAFVIFDVSMPDRSDQVDDIRFAEAVKRHGRVIVPLYAVSRKPEGKTVPGGGAGERELVYPYKELFDTALDFGFVSVEPDADGILRSQSLFSVMDSLELHSIPAAAALRSGFRPEFAKTLSGFRLSWKRSGDGAVWSGFPPPANLLLNKKFATRFFPMRPDSFEFVEYLKVLEGDTPAEFFKDAVVIVGISAVAGSDLHRVPGGSFLPGCFLLANSVSGLWHGVTIEQLPPYPALGVALLVGGLVVFAVLRWGAFTGAAAVFAALILWSAGWAALLWNCTLVIPLTAPLASFTALFSGAACWALFFLEREWAVRSLPTDAVLLLPPRCPTLVGNRSEQDNFPSRLTETWDKIRSICGFVLIAARVHASHEAAAPLLEAARKSGDSETGPPRLHIIPYASAAPPAHRMILPLPFRDDEYSVIGFDGPARPEMLKSAAALVLSLAAHYAALEEQEKKQALLFSTIRAITGAIDAKDPITAGHSERVAVLARDLSLWLGYSAEQAEELFFAGILHDVGKIGVPDAVLTKQGKLDEEDFSAMKRHPAMGAKIVSPIDLPAAVISGVLQHHERLDGKGYPYGTTVDNISDAAKILKIADVYDALISERQYKKGWPREKALELLQAGKGVEFDARMVDVFVTRMAPEKRPSS